MTRMPRMIFALREFGGVQRLVHVRPDGHHTVVGHDNRARLDEAARGLVAQLVGTGELVISDRNIAALVPDKLLDHPGRRFVASANIDAYCACVWMWRVVASNRTSASSTTASALRPGVTSRGGRSLSRGTNGT
jgi:hypothetical protein